MPLKNRAWALRQVERDGRPVRLMTICLLQDEKADAWTAWSQEQKAEKLAPHMVDGEYIKWDQWGEGHIVPLATGGRPRSDVAHRELAVLQKEAKDRKVFEKAVEKRSREVAAMAYAQAVAPLLPVVVQLEEMVVRLGLDGEASEGDRRLAIAAAKDIKDRIMGKATQAIEVTRDEGLSPARRALEGVVVRPASADVLVEQVADEHAGLLEAGDVVVEDAE